MKSRLFRLLASMLTRGLLDTPRRRGVMGLPSLVAYFGVVTVVLGYDTGSNLPFWQVWCHLALSGKTWNNPALGGELLVLRNDQEAVCYRIGPAEAAVGSALESPTGSR